MYSLSAAKVVKVAPEYLIGLQDLNCKSTVSNKGKGKLCQQKRGEDGFDFAKAFNPPSPPPPPDADSYLCQTTPGDVRNQRGERDQMLDKMAKVKSQYLVGMWVSSY